MSSELSVGWKLVPIQPTPAMLKAVDDEAEDKHLARGRAISAWGLMLDAVPEPEPSLPVMQGMETAPRDGTHILVKYIVTQYVREPWLPRPGEYSHGEYRAVGHKWEEFWFVDGKFESWSGTDKSRTINGGGEPIGWAPLPDAQPASHNPFTNACAHEFADCPPPTPDDDARLSAALDMIFSPAQPGTPGAKWRAEGSPDPHGERYENERANLCMGDLTDDELANGVFLHGNEPLDIDKVMSKAPGYHPSIAWLTAAKDRIRWLSRALEKAQAGASHE